MARKNIYVKEEHEALFERAEKLAGEVGLSQTIVTALEQYVADHEETQKEAFRLKCIIEANLLPAITETAELRLSLFPARTIASASDDVRSAMEIHAGIIRLPHYTTDDYTILVEDFVHYGLDHIIEYFEDKLNDAEKSIPEGRAIRDERLRNER